jgi:hypothetical protein
MCSYNKLNGTFAAENHRLLTEILREEWGFEGLRGLSSPTGGLYTTGWLLCEPVWTWKCPAQGQDG